MFCLKFIFQHLTFKNFTRTHKYTHTYTHTHKFIKIKTQLVSCYEGGNNIQAYVYIIYFHIHIYCKHTQIHSLHIYILICVHKNTNAHTYFIFIYIYIYIYVYAYSYIFYTHIICLHEAKGKFISKSSKLKTVAGSCLFVLAN